ncbi:MAG: nucleotidyltransferase domain-containing protein [Alphaproteobacteria bacterium]|nr:nucleotidyltransferase domain-containing protein [Alphaproteobacteria bacterium]
MSNDSPEERVASRLRGFPQVQKVILFGSRARGDAGFRADIDLAVDCPTADARVWSDIVEAAEEAPTLLKLDLVRLDRAPKELADAIRNEGRVLYERAERQAEV